MIRNQILINRFEYLLTKKKNIAFFCHRKPDSDTIGSMLGFFLSLPHEDGVELFSPDPIPKNLLFLPQARKIKNLNTFKPLSDTLLVAFDCGDFSQTGLDPNVFKTDQKSLCVNIDHHGNEDFGDLNIVDREASSTAEIIYFLLEKTGRSIDREIATCLLAGIMGDTDNFKNPNTSTKTLRTTSALLARGVNLKKLSKYLNYNKTFISLKLWGRVLARIKKHPKLKIISTFVTLDDINETKCLPEDIDGIANFLNSIPDVKASFVLSEPKRGEIKGSFRTLCPEVDVSKIANYFGGGGHKRAAGFTRKGRLLHQGNLCQIDFE